MYVTLCFVGNNVLVVIPNMCLMNTSKKEPKKIKKTINFECFFLSKGWQPGLQNRYTSYIDQFTGDNDRFIDRYQF
jgi:hypothetical protein